MADFRRARAPRASRGRGRPGRSLSLRGAGGAGGGSGELAARCHADDDAARAIEFAVELHAAPRDRAAEPARLPELRRLPEPTLPGRRRPAVRLHLRHHRRAHGPSASRGRTSRRARAPPRRCSASSPDDRWLCCLPLFHVGGLAIFMRSAIYGTTVVAEPGFDAGAGAGPARGGEVTLASLVPDDARRACATPGSSGRPGLRAILLGGGPIPPELLDWALGLGLPVRPTYGMTETRSQIATAEVGERLAPPAARARRSGSPTTARSSCAARWCAADGWLHTGDRGRLTTTGLLEVHGRMDDLIVTGGENVAAARGGGRVLLAPGRDGRRRARRSRIRSGESDRGRSSPATWPRSDSSRTAARACPASRCRSAIDRARRAAANRVREGRTRAVRVPRP